MTPEAPERLSTTICWPSAFDTAGPRIRAFTSTVPPGGNGTIRRIGRSGYFAGCANARGIALATKMHDSTISPARFMLIPLRLSGLCRAQIAGGKPLCQLLMSGAGIEAVIMVAQPLLRAGIVVDRAAVNVDRAPRE